jgi:ABC-type multidrug transport system fused ATPase/permease subunit
MSRLVFELIRPYRGWLSIVFAAMLVQIGTSLAAPWPLKLVIDDALGSHHLPHWLEWAHDYGFGKHTLGVALFAGVATLAIAVVGAIASCGFASISTCTGSRYVTMIMPGLARWCRPSQATSRPSRISPRPPRWIS